MIKTGQSILDFINLLPLHAIDMPRAPLTNKEAQTLYDIWESEHDKWGNLLVPTTVDSNIVASLISKGYIIGTRNTASILESNQRSVGITKKGKDVIRNIILMTEKNMFDGEIKKNVDYENIHRALTGNKIASGWLSKIIKLGQNEVSADFADVDLRRLESYLSEILSHVNNILHITQQMRDKEVASRKGENPIRYSIFDVVAQSRYSLQRIAEYGKYCEDLVNTARQSPAYQEVDNGTDIEITE